MTIGIFYLKLKAKTNKHFANEQTVKRFRLMYFLNTEMTGGGVSEFSN